MISNDAAISHAMAIGREYKAKLSYNPDNDKEMKVRIVGIFAPISGGASISKSVQTDDLFVCDMNVFKKIFVSMDSVSRITWEYYLNYNTISYIKIPSLINAYNDISFKSESNGIVFDYKGASLLERFGSKKTTIDIMNLLFSVPMFLLLLFCIFFISKLNIEADKNEISVYQSRGASFSDITKLYLIQSGILILPVSVLGPIIALMIFSLLSRFTGFLQVGKGIPLVPDFNLSVLIYDIAACLLIILIIIVPSIFEMRNSIVERKQRNVKRQLKPFWKRYYIDFILLLISCYGYYNFTSKNNAILKISASENQLSVEPLTYIIVILFLFSIGLFL
jgi:putative ABC transport system permease protein